MPRERIGPRFSSPAKKEKDICNIYILYTKNSWDAIFHRSSIDEDRNVIIIKNKEIIERLMDDRGFKEEEEEEFGRLADYNGSVLNNSSRDSTASTNREIGSILFGRS